MNFCVCGLIKHFSTGTVSPFRLFPGHSRPHPSLEHICSQLLVFLLHGFILCASRQQPETSTCDVNVSARLTFFFISQSRESTLLPLGGGHWSPRCLLSIVMSLCPCTRNSTGSAMFTTPFSCDFSSLSSLICAVTGSGSPQGVTVTRKGTS